MIRTDMSLFNALQLKLDPYCKCSRATSMLHCPKCGSTDVRVAKRASKGKVVLLPDGGELSVRALGCRRCGITFLENTTFFTCEAPATSWRSEDTIVNKIVPVVEPKLSAFQQETLRQLAVLNPRRAPQVQAALKRVSGGEEFEREIVEKQAPLESTSSEASEPVVDLFKPPDLIEMDQTEFERAKEGSKK